MTRGTNDTWDQWHVGPMVRGTIELTPIHIHVARSEPNTASAGTEIRLLPAPCHGSSVTAVAGSRPATGIRHDTFSHITMVFKTLTQINAHPLI